MECDITFHYPPQLMTLLIEVIPLLNPRKEDVFLFFQGAGVGENLMREPKAKWKTDKKSINKYEITRHVLTKLNEHGEKYLRERREVLRRVTEFNSFSSCWPKDQLKAKGLVAEIREVINEKDSFTRMAQEREKERQKRMAIAEAERQATKARKEELINIKDRFAKLFGEKNPYLRGKSLEALLNDIFEWFKISVRESFAVIGDEKEGVIEQIDGVIEICGHYYFVETKWWKEPLGKPEISEHLVRVYHRAESRAIIISASDFTSAAITTCKEALAHKVVILCTLAEIYHVLEREADIVSFLQKKVEAAILDKNPMASAL